MALRGRNILRIVVVAVVLGCAAACGVGIALDLLEQKKADETAQQRIDAVIAKADGGDAQGAMDDLIAVIEELPDAAPVEDSVALYGLVRRFPADVLADATTSAPAEVREDAGGRFVLLCRAALVEVWPASEEGLAARADLASAEWIGDQASEVVYDIVFDALATVEDPAFFDELVVAAGFKGSQDTTAAADAMLAYNRETLAARVLGRMGTRGWTVLADRIAGGFEDTIAVLGLERAGEGIVAFLESYLDTEDTYARQSFAEVIASIARDDEHPDQAAAQTLLRESVTDPYIAIAAFSFYIADGDDATIPHLIAALDQVGTVSEAQLFLNCGNKELEQAARRWASEHGYEITTQPGSASDTWGRGN